MNKNDDDEIHIERIPIITPTALDLLFAAAGLAPIRYLIKEEFEAKYGKTLPSL